MVIQKSESVMNGFFQAFRMEVLRAIQNSFFPTTYFAILITLFLNIYLYTTTDSYVSVAYLLEYSFIGSLTMLFYIWGVLPHGLSYCVDKRSGFLRQIGNRCPVRNYCIAKCCAAFLTSALTMAMSISTFLWLLSFFRPLDNDVYLDASGYRLWYPSHPLFYFIIAATILSLGSGLFSIVALWISSYIQNSFAIMASPLLLYYTQSIIFNKLGLNGLRFLSFSSVFHFTPGFSSPAANFFYTCGYLLTLAVFFGWLFIKSVEKRWQYD